MNTSQRYYNANYLQPGAKNGYDILRTINNFQYKELDRKWKEHIKRMFPMIKDEDLIMCNFHADKKAKCDLDVILKPATGGDTIKIYLSVKSGSMPSMHQEYYSNFHAFLKNLGIPPRYMKILELYHFGYTDKIADAENPLTREQIMARFGNYIDEFNMFMTNKTIIERIIYRTCIRGADPTRKAIDFFYYGGVDNGFLWSKDELIAHGLNDIGKAGKLPPHFGKLVYQPSGRKIDRDDRFYVKIKWPELASFYYTLGVKREGYDKKYDDTVYENRFDKLEKEKEILEEEKKSLRQSKKIDFEKCLDKLTPIIKVILYFLLIVIFLKVIS